MKNFLKIALSLLVVLVIGYFIYSNYQKTAVLKNVVHIDAESVLKVDLFDIKKTLVFDAFLSPKYYWDNVEFKKNEKEKDTIDEQNKGINLEPYALVFYTIKNAKNTLFTTLPITNINDFEAYALKYTSDKNISINKGDYSYAIDKKSKMVYAWNSSYLAIAISPKIVYEDYKQIFDDVLLENKLISDTDHSFIKKLADSENHITYENKDSEIVVNFLDGKAIIEGSLFTDSSNNFNSEVKYNALPNASLQLYFDANFGNKTHKKAILNALEDVSFFAKNNIDVVTLFNKANGVFDFGIKGTTLQKDTIITYEYDDNFDKVAIKSIQEKQAPIITMNLGVKDSLYQYLKEQGAIENKVLKAIPYYTFYTDNSIDNINFSTSKKSIPGATKTSGYFFSLNTNFTALQNDLKLPKASRITSVLDKLRINAQQQNDTLIVLEGKLTAINTDVNIISQLFFGLKDKDSIK